MERGKEKSEDHEKRSINAEGELKALVGSTHEAGTGGPSCKL